MKITIKKKVRIKMRTPMKMIKIIVNDMRRKVRHRRWTYRCPN